MRKKPPALLLRLAKEMRRSPTSMEHFAWELLRDRRCLGLKFRRQKILAGFIVDFYCAEHRLALELDGGIHDSAESRARDADRDAVLAGLGVRILRIRNAELTLASLTSRLTASIGRIYANSALTPSPPRGEGDGGEAERRRD